VCWWAESGWDSYRRLTASTSSSPVRTRPDDILMLSFMLEIDAEVLGVDKDRCYARFSKTR